MPLLIQDCLCLQTAPLQLSLLAENCIHLEELHCAVAGSWKPSEHRPFFPNLISCRIFTKQRETVHAFLAYNNSLRDFQVSSTPSLCFNSVQTFLFFAHVTPSRFVLVGAALICLVFALI